MMELIVHPSPDQWSVLCRRPVFDREFLRDNVREVMMAVKSGGDERVSSYSSRWGGFAGPSWMVSPVEMAEAVDRTDVQLQKAIRTAKANIERFHRAQVQDPERIETFPGVMCWRKSLPIERVGLYIPGGSAPLFSALLMLGIPALIAGCPEIIVCTPASPDGAVHPAVLFTAHELGIARVFKVGGAQAIAAMTYGTETIPAVSKIFGPGNQYVTMAKELAIIEGVAIDMPAGPSEVLIVADSSGHPAFIAADLLSQAEHGSDSQVMLVSTDRELIDRTRVELAIQVEDLPRRDIAIAALKNSRAVLLSSLDECLEFSNRYAPEHLILAVRDPEQCAGQVVNAGSVFLGNYSCESAGDYASGTNHTLPTNGYAKAYSGVSVDSFVRKVTFQSISEKGILGLGPVIETLAEAEQLKAHRNAVSIRLTHLSK